MDLKLSFDYASCVRDSERVAWQLDEMITESDDLDFSRAFLPDAMNVDRGLAPLHGRDWLSLNQIASRSYLNFFAFVEEFIIITVGEQFHARLGGEPATGRALARFADEEIKHQLMFERFAAAFERGFGTPAKVLDTREDVARSVAQTSEIAQLLLTLHLELVTQSHYIDAMKGTTHCDPLFVKLLHHHWVEEAQHAKIDMLLLGELASEGGAEQSRAAFDEYVAMLRALDELLAQQSRWEIETLTEHRRKPFDGAGREELVAAQHRAHRDNFLATGLVNRRFVRFLAAIPGIGPEATPRTRERLGLR